jgi:hypothetical protein
MSFLAAGHYKRQWPSHISLYFGGRTAWSAVDGAAKNKVVVVVVAVWVACALRPKDSVVKKVALLRDEPMREAMCRVVTKVGEVAWSCVTAGGYRSQRSGVLPSL